MFVLRYSVCSAIGRREICVKVQTAKSEKKLFHA